MFGFYRDRSYLPLYGLLDLQFALSHSAKLVAGEHCVHCPDGCDRGVPVHADRAESHSCEHWPQVQPVSTTSRIVQYRQQLLQQPVLKWIVTTFQCSKTACTEYRYLISFAHHICPCCKKKVKMQRYENLSTPVTLLCFSGRSWWLVSVHKQGTCIGVYTNLGANSMEFHLQSYLLLFASRVKSDETSHTRLFPNSSLIVFVF